MEQRVSIDSGYSLDRIVRQSVLECGVYVLDKDLYLLHEADVPLLGSDVVTGAVALAVSFPHVLLGEVLACIPQNVESSIKTYLHPNRDLALGYLSEGSARGRR